MCVPLTPMFLDQRSSQPTTSSLSDTNAVIAAISFGKNLKSSRRQDSTGQGQHSDHKSQHSSSQSMHFTVLIYVVYNYACPVQSYIYVSFVTVIYIIVVGELKRNKRHILGIFTCKAYPLASTIRYIIL